MGAGAGSAGMKTAPNVSLAIARALPAGAEPPGSAPLIHATATGRPVARFELFDSTGRLIDLYSALQL